MGGKSASDKGQLSFRVLSVVISGVFAVLAAVAGAIVGWWNPTPPPKPVVVVSKEEEPSWRQKLEQSPISLRAWQSLAGDTSLSPSRRKELFAEYLGARVTWRGTVSHVVDRRDEDGLCIVVLYASRDECRRAELAREQKRLLAIPVVRCRFPTSRADEVRKLQPYAEIVVQGTLADRVMAGSLLGTDLYKCELLWSRAPEVAQDETGLRR